MAHKLSHLQKHKTLRYLCVMTVFGSQVCASSTVSSSRLEAFKEGNCCVAQAFNYNKRHDFSIVARFRVLIPAAMPIYFLPTMLLAVSWGFVRLEWGAFGRLRHALVHIQTTNALGRRPRPPSTHTQPFRPVRVVEVSI